MLYLFTTDSLRQCAVPAAMGATSPMLLGMVFVQAGTCALPGTGPGRGACAVAGPVFAAQGLSS